MSQFWQDLENQGETLQKWQDNHPINKDVETACRYFADVLLQPAAMREVSDPRNQSRVYSFRQSYASQWSAVTSYMEGDIAAELDPISPTYEAFCRNADNHWFLGEYADLIKAEKEMFAEHGIDLAGKRVCMIGPGAIPYTGLAMAAAGAHVTLVDLYAPACEWCRTWLERFFPQGNWDVLQTEGQLLDFSGFDLVFVASMLFNRSDVLRAIHANQPRQVLVRTTFARRPLSLLEHPMPEAELNLLGEATFVAESHPPLHVSSVALLYSYPRPS